MNVPVIVNELAAAVRTVTPAVHMKAEASGDDVKITMSYQDAMRLTEFLNDHRTPKVPDPRQGQLFDPAKYA
jgi:hypothetical protein